MTAGVDGKSLDGMSEKRINELIDSLKDFSYQPNPARRVYIEKKNSTKKRPLGIPSTEDKLVQEVVRMILESIYEPTFSKSSHGFRPKRSCHTALQQIQKQFTGVAWFVEGDIHACFDSFDHHVLIAILRERIEDENFIALMWKMLKAGYMEQWIYHCTYSGTPQGSGVSPILANIYLSKMDDFAESLKNTFDRGNCETNRAYGRAASKLFYIRQRNRKNWQSWGKEERRDALKLQKAAIAKLHDVPSMTASNQNYKRLFYCRYADDFLIGVIGSHEDAQQIKEQFSMVTQAWNNQDYVLDSGDFTGVDFKTVGEHELTETRTMDVLLVQPNAYPKKISVGTELEDLQAMVGGDIEVTYPFEDEVAIILNESGKINGLPLNRAIYTEDGDMQDIYAGDFLVVGLTEDDFGSLTSEQM